MTVTRSKVPELLRLPYARHPSLQPALLGVVLFLITGVLLSLSVRSFAATAADVSHTADLLSGVQRFRITLDDLETAQRGFLLTGTERYLEPYRVATARVAPELQALRIGVASDPVSSAQVAQIARLARENISELEQTIQLWRDKGEDAARTIVITDRGLRATNEMGRLIANLEREVSARLATRVVIEQQRLHQLEGAAFGALLTGLTFFLLATQKMSRSERLARIAEGNRSQQEGEFRQLADSMPHMAWMADADGWIFWYNRRWFEFTGTTHEQMKGWGWKIVHDPAMLPEVMEGWNASIVSGRTFEMELPLRGADGRFRSFLTRVIPVRNDRSEIIRWFGTNTDITERVEAERIASQFAAIVESSQDAIVGKTLDGVIMSWNAGAEKVYGYSRDEILGQPMQVLLPPGTSEEEGEILRRVRDGETTDSLETTRLTKAGNIILISLAVCPIRNRHGDIIGASHIARDITERKQFESRMLESQKLESLGVLAGGIAHDFNNLLTGIMGNASLLNEVIPAGNSGRALIAAIVSASEHAAGHTRQLLAYAGKGRFVIEAIDLSDLTEQITGLVEASIPRKVSLVLELDRQLPVVEGDVSQLQQVIMNLIINGAEAIGDAVGTVTIKTWVQDEDGRRLRMQSARPHFTVGSSVVLEVSDTGIGMNAQTIAKIFDPFFTTKFTGRGLGLAAVQGIIRSHHGMLEVSSSLGNGSRFRMLLPVASKSLGSLHRQEPIAPPHGHGHVLVVEDDDIIRSFVKAVLERFGYSIELARHGGEAIEIFARSPFAFDLVFLDLTMPVMNGEEVFHRIQAIRPGVPVLVTSGYNSNTAIQHLTGDGLVGFIQKPYTVAQLAEKVGTALSVKTAGLLH